MLTGNTTYAGRRLTWHMSIWLDWLGIDSWHIYLVYFATMTDGISRHVEVDSNLGIAYITPPHKNNTLSIIITYLL